MKIFAEKTAALTAGFFFLIAFLLTCIDLACFDRSFFQQEYEKYNNAEQIGISKEQLMEATEVLLDYLQDNRDDLQITAEIQGESRDVFNQREMDHMADVKTLYKTVLSVRNGCAVMTILLVGGLLGLRKNNRLFILARSYLQACGLFLAIILGLGFFAYVDFTRFWTLFHQVLFTNDLWLLNPNTDVLIMMVPEGFFYDLVFRIMILFLGGAALLAILAKLKLQFSKKGAKQ